jgi:2-dehydro-3-deoxygluconokinase
MADVLKVPDRGALDFIALGGMAIRPDIGIVPFHKATEAAIYVSGGDYKVAANLAN